MKEQAGWLVGAPDLRPYDCPARPNSSTPWTGIDIAVADPSRHGYLSNNQRYFKKAAAAGRYVHKKQTNYNRLLNQFSVRYLVDYTPLGFEVTGGQVAAKGWHLVNRSGKWQSARAAAALYNSGI